MAAQSERDCRRTAPCIDESHAEAVHECPAHAEGQQSPRGTSDRRDTQVAHHIILKTKPLRNVAPKEREDPVDRLERDKQDLCVPAGAPIDERNRKKMIRRRLH